MLYRELFKAAASASWIPVQEKGLVYMYIRGILKIKNEFDSLNNDASNYLLFNSEFLEKLAKSLPFHTNQLMLFDGYIKRLIDEEGEYDISETDTESDVISVSDMLKKTIIQHITTMLTMMDMDGNTFLLNMDLGNKRIHVQVDTIK